MWSELKSKRDLAIVVQGLFEKSDSIGFDAIFQASILGTFHNVEIYSEKFDEQRYPGHNVLPVSELYGRAERGELPHIIYHYCDGWPEFDNFLSSYGGRATVRWHNNTPPWFYAEAHRHSTERTLRGFEQICAFIKSPGIDFWVNSNFTARQLKALGGAENNIAVVYPGSRYLLESNDTVIPSRRRESGIRLLFVSRVVAHKGHRHIIALADYLQNSLKKDVVVEFVGRHDSSSGYKAELDALAQDRNVKLKFHGEVSETQLAQLYADADVFTCFSEHEGFGMPVFEAMRCGLPVIAWARTAFAELLAEHPLCSTDLDLRRASAAIQLLQSDAKFREQIVSLQHRLAEGYSRATVESQLEHAIAEQYSNALYPKLDHSDAIFVAEARNLIKECASDLRRLECTSPKVGHHEYGDNFVSPYDLASYSALMKRESAAIERIEALRNGGLAEFVIPSADFSGDGTPVAEGKSFLCRSTGSHVIFGPYMPWLKGAYIGKFLISFEHFKKNDLEILIDIASSARGILNKRTIRIADYNTPNLELPFLVARDGEIIEFRIKVVNGSDSKALFSGVSISLDGLRQQNLGNADSSLFRMCPRWLTDLVISWQLVPINRVHLPKKAREIFHHADSLRNRQWWNDAAAEYRRGLTIAPGSFRHIVHLGDCFWEAGDFVEAERAYKSALSIMPNNADVHVKLARLFVKLGAMGSGEQHYIAAAKSNSAASIAVLELGSLGIPLESIIDILKVT